jgi:hypothetical protein
MLTHVFVLEDCGFVRMILERVEGQMTMVRAHVTCDDDGGLVSDRKNDEQR